MVRNPFTKVKTKEDIPTQRLAEQKETTEPDVQFVEREITLSVINSKLNYVIEMLHKFAESAGIDLEKK